MAEFFAKLSEENVVQRNTLKRISMEFEQESYERVKTVESDDMLFVMLNLPLTQHDGKSLCELAIDEKRMRFLNNDRMSLLFCFFTKQIQ